MKNISKEFSGNRVLKDINIEVKKGEIHAIIGENGAGKSTLMNILFGMPVIASTGGFEGKIELEDKPIDIKSPHEAMDYGIGMVHQEFMLIPGYTITENIKINREITKKNAISKILSKQLEDIDFEAMNKDARIALNKLDMTIEEYAIVAGLSVGLMQFIEIAREIDKTGLKLLVFDEPTAVLTESEAENLIKAIKKIADTGIAVLFISHRLDEIMSVAHRVTILRDGELVATKDVKDTNVIEVAKLMVGREIYIKRKETEIIERRAETILNIKGLHVNMPGEKVNGLNLEVNKGEILGIGGLAGQGKIGIANGIMGVYPTAGEIIFNGKQIKLNDTRNSLELKLGFVSEDRRGVGLLLDESIEMNIAFTHMQINDGFIKKIGPISYKNKKEIRKHANSMIKELDIRCTSPAQYVGRLSGGNQQKVCLARALTLSPDLLFVSEPTRGIDIGAKKIVLDLLLKLNKEYGMTIVMTSSELSELRTICDRIVIISKGKDEGILAPDATDEEFGLTMSGSLKAIERSE